MKYTNILKLSAIALFSICASCGDKKDDHAGHDHGDHSGHDHGDKKDDHAGHDHDDKKDAHAGHDHDDKKDAHAGHDHDDKKDDHAGHDHDDKKDPHAGHDHDHGDHDHSKCGVVVGPKGGRMIEEYGELNLNDKGQLTFEFKKTPSDDTKLTLLIDSEVVELTQDGNAYSSASVASKLPAEVHVSIKSDEEKFVKSYQIEAGECTKCKNAKLACTCHNHDHGHHGHDHGDHKGHDHGDHKGHDHGDHDHGDHDHDDHSH